MKSSKQILSLLTHQPQFSSLVQHGCYQKFMALLPPRFQTAIAFVYIKNRTLFIALAHPGYKMELNYNKELFKTLLATVREYAPECHDQLIDNIILFNSKYHTPKESNSHNTIPYYHELSYGNFEIDYGNEALEKKFLHTKSLIKKYHTETKI